MNKIVVNCFDNQAVEVDATVFGEWAAHPGISGDGRRLHLDWWVVTHVPTGRTFASAVGRLTEGEALELARVMGERVPVGLIPDIPREVLFYELPLDVRKFLRSVIFDVRGELLV